MSKIAHYLQEHLVGEVTTSPDARRHFAHDASVLQMMPAIVVYPRGETDVRKTARFVWQVAERGKVIPLTARGLGSDVSGAALGSGIVMVLPAYMNKVLTLDPRRQVVDVEAGINYDKLQQTLFTHGLFLPPYPASLQYSTIGGAINNNASGEKSLKYGTTVDFVDRLRVVLANGEVIETSRLSKRELSKKMGLSSLEGEVYRSLDALIEDNKELIKEAGSKIKAKRNAAGYRIFDVKQKDGSFDLTPLMVGSQGTLGIVTEALMRVVAHNPVTKMALISMQSYDHLQDCIDKVLELKPSMLEVVNGALVDQMMQINPNQIDGILPSPKTAVVLLVEFDDDKDGKQTRAMKRLQKIASRWHASFQIAEKPEEQESMLTLRRSVGSLMAHSTDRRKMLPVADDIAVPPSSFAAAMQKIENLYRDLDLPAAVWGHAGDGVIRAQPLLDLSQLGDRQKLFKITEEIYHFAIEQGGTTSASHGDGRMRAPYLKQLYGEDIFNLFIKIKAIFDPYNTLNPGVKFGTSNDDLKALLRSDYTLGHRLDHMPRT